MNKPNQIRTIMNIDKDYFDFLSNNFISYDNAHNHLHNRGEYFKSVNSSFIVHNFKVTKINEFVKFKKKSKHLLDKLKNLYGPGEIFNLQLSKINQDGIILPHIDHGLDFVFSHRIHIPLVTNENVVFTINKKKYNLLCKKVYEINNLMEHSVKNKSEFDRIHLILDYISCEYIPFVKPPNSKYL